MVIKAVINRTLNPRPSTLDRSGFIQAYGGVYEDSSWVAEAAWEAGVSAAHDEVDALHLALQAEVDAASDARQLALLNAHPDLAGRAAVRGELTAASTEEQASAGLDQCTPDEFERFVELNTRYRARFPFPFIMAVRGATRGDILDAFAVRIENSAEDEFATALAQVSRIARLRLDAMAES